MADTKTRAVEVAVVILLATAGIAATIGIYESQEHRDASLWFTASAAALIVAVLIPLVVFGAFPLIEHFGRREPRRAENQESVAASQGAAQAAMVTTTQVIPDSWIKPEHLAEYLDAINKTMEEHGFGQNPNLPIVSVSPAELSRFYADHLEIEAAKLAEPFIGRKLKVTGRVTDVSSTNAEHFTVDLAPVSTPEGRPHVYARFTKDWADAVTTLRNRDSVTVIGRVQSVGLAFLFLEECELVEQ